jgi:hypothetical protein
VRSGDWIGLYQAHRRTDCAPCLPSSCHYP